MKESNQANKDALGDLDAPGTISNFGVAGEEKYIPKAAQREVTLDVPINQVTVRREHLEVSEPMVFNEDDLALIKSTKGRDLTDTEFKTFIKLACIYRLDPIRNQIWAVKYGNAQAQIFAGRDGFLEIAHRSGHFDGMKSWVDYDEDGRNPIKAHCVVWRDDMTHPFETEVLFREYTTGKNLWQSKPSVMIIKVAESVCLRKAFSVSGLYAPEEMSYEKS